MRLLGGDAFPEFPGKAIDAKLMVPWMAMVTAVFAVGRGNWEQTLATAAWALASFVACLDAAGMWMTASQTEATAAAGNGFLLAYMALSRWALDNGILHFKVRPKLHMLQHIIMSLEDLAGGPTSNTCVCFDCWAVLVARLSHMFWMTSCFSYAAAAARTHH